MTIFLSEVEGGVVVQARAEGEALGDLTRLVHPGGSAFGLSYEQLAALGPGAHEVGGGGAKLYEHHYGSEPPSTGWTYSGAGLWTREVK